jgi:hypothetical protein
MPRCMLKGRDGRPQIPHKRAGVSNRACRTRRCARSSVRSRAAILGAKCWARPTRRPPRWVVAPTSMAPTECWAAISWRPAPVPASPCRPFSQPYWPALPGSFRATGLAAQAVSASPAPWAQLPAPSNTPPLLPSSPARGRVKDWFDVCRIDLSDLQPIALMHGLVIRRIGP